jgi:UDP-N-acetylmuramyl pentapeptide phosphotransferase/UDP-N-acetylglucosamine-1-phosphate transferase
LEIYIVLGFALICGGIGAWMIAYWGDNLGLIDQPNERSSHIIAVPKGGGIGILAAFFFLSVYLRISWVFWLPIVGISIMSFWGDWIDISPKLRLLLQCFAAMIVIVSLTEDGFRYFGVNSSVISPVVLNSLVWGLLVVFVVGTANFFNFMDGINGIAGLTGTIAFSFLALVGWTGVDSSVPSVLALGMALACLGFLPLNFPVARVFMGDVGSVLLGTVFACLVVWISKNWVDLFCYAGSILPFYADELSTMLERIIDKESLTTAHRRHLYQVLANEGGLAHWKISMSYGIIQLGICMILFYANEFGLLAVLIVIICTFFIFFMCSQKIKLKYQ